MESLILYIFKIMNIKYSINDTNALFFHSTFSYLNSNIFLFEQNYWFAIGIINSAGIFTRINLIRSICDYCYNCLKTKSAKFSRICTFSAPSRARTGDLLIKSQMLYQLSYGCEAKLSKFVTFSKFLLSVYSFL